MGSRRDIKATAKPPFRWVGGKQRVRNKLVNEWLPPVRTGYCEPFLGAGTAFVELASTGRLPRGSKVYLSDGNLRVARAWSGLRSNPAGVERRLRLWIEEHAIDPDATFDAARRLSAGEMDPDATAAWMMYVCSVSYNGLYRTNRQGVFNAARDVSRDPSAQIDISNVWRLSACLRGAFIGGGDFGLPLSYASEGWLVYADPPYFGQYDRHDGAAPFRAEDRLRLRDGAVAAHRRGAEVVINDADVPETRELYSPRLGFQVTAELAPSSVSIRSDRRGSARILVARLLHG